MNKLKLAALVVALVLNHLHTISAQTILKGLVMDAKTDEPVLFATIAVYQHNELITGTETDLDGKYIIKNLDSGIYDVEISYVGYHKYIRVGCVVRKGTCDEINFDLSENKIFKRYKSVGCSKLIPLSNKPTNGKVTRSKIKKLPLKDINAIKY